MSPTEYSKCRDTLPIHERIRSMRREVELPQIAVAQELAISQSRYCLFELGYVTLPERLVNAAVAFLLSRRQGTGRG
jgi:predicted transcriptional regulator